MKQSVKIAISGVKNSGKTTLIEKLIPELQKKGIRTAVIKHDGHDFEPDVPGTDSYRIRKAGAYGTAVFSMSKYLLVKEYSNIEGTVKSKETVGFRETELARLFPEADLILLEGFKDSRYPKLEIVRKGNSEESVCVGKNLLAILSDFEPDHPEEIPLLDLNDPEGIADFLIHQVQKMKQEQEMDQGQETDQEQETNQEQQIDQAQEINQAEEMKQTQQMQVAGQASCKVMLSQEDYYFGPGVFHLLQKIQETGSIRSAAMALDLSYTKACKMINRAERGSGVHFLERTVGGRNGGKSVLTDEGQAYLDKYQLLLEESEKAVRKLYQEIFDEFR